jgi:putative hydrolase of the HAD superfamily
MIKAILFDYGGVLAEEGFRKGLHELARKHGLDPEQTLRSGMDAVYESGYVLGRGSEPEFWRLLEDKLGVRVDKAALRKFILEHFVLRSWMIELVRRLRKRGLIAAILSDQTDWLDLLDARDHFYREFDHVFTSFHLGKGKRDPTVFTDVVRALGIQPSEALFVDDNPDNVRRAKSRGLHGIHFRNREPFIADLGGLLNRKVQA